ncbi:leucyl-tRNA synthetase, partial [mine drainage metagenome]
MKYMTSEIEKKWQERWKNDRIFEPAVDESGKKFLITVPWPYTSGSLHVGHGRTYT